MVGFVAKMDKTMITRTCQLQRLISDYMVIEEFTNDEEAGVEGGRRGLMKKAVELAKKHHVALLNVVRVKTPQCRHHHHLPHPKDSPVLRG